MVLNPDQNDSGAAQMQGFSVFRRRGGGQRLAFVVQIDNLSPITRCIGLAETACLLADLSARIGTVLDVAPPPATGPRGQIRVLADARHETGVLHIASQLRALIRAGFELPSSAPRPVFSGVLVRGDTTIADDRLIDRALRHLARGADPDIALIHATADSEPFIDRIDLDAVEPWFQPQTCCHSGAVTGFELLARASDPVRGVMQPAAFLPALGVDQQRQLTRGMLSKGLGALSRWAAAGFHVGSVSLNASTADLSDPQFADFVLWELDRQDVAPARLVIEVMEDVSPLDAPKVVQENVARLAGLGCGIDLDDFGTGFASLEALRRLPVRRVKIDRSFVTGCDSDPAQQRMILAILALAERMGVEALAEGVETPAQHSFVAQVGCSHAQGYAIARPMPLRDTLDFLSARKAEADRLPVIRRRA